MDIRDSTKQQREEEEAMVDFRRNHQLNPLEFNQQNQNLNQSEEQNQRRRKNRTKNMSILEKTTFQRIFLLCLIRLIIYLYKLYEDIEAVGLYHKERAWIYELVSTICLVIPSIIFALYQAIAEFIKNDNFNLKLLFTRFVNGLLLIPWQIKRHLDGLYFASQNLFSLRKPKVEEKENLTHLKRDAEQLEFFEDFYAGFIQVCLQVYLLSTFSVDNNKFIIIGEVIGSALSIMSMLIAVKRKDDGPLTVFLSYVGWISMFTSRIIVFALTATIIGAYTVLLCLIHALIFTIWIYKISQDACEEDHVKESERLKRRGLHQLLLCFFFFGLPSLVLWPYMFYLKKNGRAQTFLLIIFIENFCLILVWWFFRKIKSEQYDQKILIGTIVLTVVAIVFLSLYFCLKPRLIDQVVLSDMRYTETESYGLYYEFCDIVFPLKLDDGFTEQLTDIRHRLSATNTNTAATATGTATNSAGTA